MLIKKQQMHQKNIFQAHLHLFQIDWEIFFCHRYKNLIYFFSVDQNLYKCLHKMKTVLSVQQNLKYFKCMTISRLGPSNLEFIFLYICIIFYIRKLHVLLHFPNVLHYNFRHYTKCEAHTRLGHRSLLLTKKDTIISCAIE